MFDLVCTVLKWLVYFLAPLVGYYILGVVTRPAPVKLDIEGTEGTIEEEEKMARLRWTKKRQQKATPADGFDLIMIGAGPSGMACAASLARLGKKVCVLDQGEQLGGGAHVFSMKGYEFETGGELACIGMGLGVCVCVCVCV